MFARIIRRTDERIAELSVLSAMQRVYREIHGLATPQPGGATVVSPLPTQEELASLVGATPETVARAPWASSPATASSAAAAASS